MATKTARALAVVLHLSPGAGVTGSSPASHGMAPLPCWRRSRNSERGGAKAVISNLTGLVGGSLDTNGRLRSYYHELIHGLPNDSAGRGPIRFSRCPCR